MLSLFAFVYFILHSYSETKLYKVDTVAVSASLAYANIHLVRTGSSVDFVKLDFTVSVQYKI